MSTQTGSASATAWLQRAQALEPLVVAGRDEAERERRLPESIFQAMRDAGLFHLWVPETYGGAELPLLDTLRVLEEVSRQDGSVGWNLTIGIESGLLSGYLPADAGQAIYSNEPGAVLATTLVPRGKAVVDGDGYRVSGRWPTASGCQHASWLLGHCVVFDGDSLRTTEQGAPVTRFFLIPRNDFQIIDTWNTTGMRGTGSHDVQVDDVKVAASWNFGLGDTPIHPGVLYHTSAFNLVGGTIASVALGIGRAAIDAFYALAPSKTFAPGQGTLSEQQIIHERVAEAEALVGSARAYLFDIAAEIDAHLAAGTPVSEATRARKDIAAANAVKSAAKAVELMFDSAGTSSIQSGSQLDRCLRDVLTVKQHAALSTARKAASGSVLLKSHAGAGT